MARMFVNTGNSLAGLELMALNPESGRAFGVTYGLFVNQVLPGTPGRQAGLQGGDVLVTADSVALRTVLSLQRAIMRSPTRAVTLSIMRRGKAETVQLKW
jgi:S1-C subfamily serine protease